jgi:hypothetical protein
LSVEVRESSIVLGPSSLAEITERAWAAGFFDGEGCTTWTKAYPPLKKKPYLRIVITQKDRRALHRFQAAVRGIGRVGGPFHHKGFHQSAWTANGIQAEYVLRLIWPWLGEVKKEQALRRLSDTSFATSLSWVSAP